MKAVIERVKDAKCIVDGKITGSISFGLLVLFCVEKGDQKEKIKPFLNKIVSLRIFEDEKGKMNFSVKEVGKEILFISQFTLSANLWKGNRPGFELSETPERAKKLYEESLEYLKTQNLKVESGVFGSHMDLVHTNDGPCTFILD